MYIILRIFQCAANEASVEKKEVERETKRIEQSIVPKQSVPARKYPSGTLPHDSLERMYDRNYMDFDLYNNPDDDDEWYDYYND